MSSPFSPASTKAAILQALHDEPLPPGKTGALVVHGDYDPATHETTVTAVMAEKIGEHWTLGQDVELHNAEFKVGVSVVASWP